MQTKVLFNALSGEFDLVRSEEIPIFLDETATIADFQTGNTYFYVGETPITFDYDLLPYPLPVPASGFNFVNLSTFDTTFVSNGGNATYLLKPSQSLQDIQVVDNGGLWFANATQYFDNLYDLQTVTNKGSITTNAIIVRNNPDTYRTRYSILGQGIQRADLGYDLNYYDDGITKLATGSKTWQLQIPDLTSNANSSSFAAAFRPNVSGTVAYLSDITTGVTDGDKGDITVSGSGAIWTVDNNAVTNAKLAQAPANTIKGNNTAALANTTDIALTVKTILGRNAANIAALPFDTFIERLSGTTANRSVVYPTPLIGQLYSNTTTSRLEWYDGTTWRSLPFAQILLTEIQNIQNNRFLGNLSGIAAPPQEVAGLDIWDSVQQSYTYNIASINEWFDTTLFTQTASQTVANTIAETSLLGTGQGTLILPASFFVVGKTLRGNIKGFMGDDAVPPTIRIQVKLNATTILDTTATTLLAITGSRRFELEFELTNRTTGVSGTIFSQGLFKYFRDNTSEEKICLLNTAANTVNTTIAQTLSVTVIWGTANTNNTITSTNFNLTKLA